MPTPTRGSSFRPTSIRRRSCRVASESSTPPSPSSCGRWMPVSWAGTPAKRGHGSGLGCPILHCRIARKSRSGWTMRRKRSATRLRAAISTRHFRSCITLGISLASRRWRARKMTRTWCGSTSAPLGPTRLVWTIGVGARRSGIASAGRRSKSSITSASTTCLTRCVAPMTRSVSTKSSPSSR